MSDEREGEGADADLGARLDGIEATLTDVKRRVAAVERECRACREAITGASGHVHGTLAAETQAFIEDMDQQFAATQRARQIEYTVFFFGVVAVVLAVELLL